MWYIKSEGACLGLILKHMKVIVHAVDNIQFMPMLNNNSIHIPVEIIFEIIIDQKQPVLNSKNIMHKQLCVGISHILNLLMSYGQ